MNSLDNVSNECSNAPYKRRKQTSQALEALGQLIRDGSFDDDLDMDKFNKNDILSLTLSKLLRHKYWPSTQRNCKLSPPSLSIMNERLHLVNVQLAAGVRTLSSEDNVTGFLVVMNTSGRIITISDNAEHYLRKNVVRSTVGRSGIAVKVRVCFSDFSILNWQASTIVSVRMTIRASERF